MLKIKIGKNWFVEYDGNCATVYENKVRQKGKKVGTERITVHGYYSDLGQALAALLQKKVAAEDIDNLERIVEAFEDVKAEILFAIKSLSKGLPEPKEEKINTDVPTKRTRKKKDEMDLII